MSNYILEHSTIGPIQGLPVESSVHQYRGIQYATLKDRFARGKLIIYGDRDKENVSLATDYGPPAPIAPNACQLEQSLIQQSLPFSQPKCSDTECLTLTVTAPEIEEGRLLPVLFFVHGGGFTTGSSSFPQNDLARLTSMSHELGLPIVSVAVNYRVGAPGFLTAPVMASAGYKPNNGLDDQRLALQWVQSNIVGFGGDPDRVTFLGESAGAASGFFYLHNARLLFHQMVSMSGTSLLRPRSREVVEQSFSSIADLLGAKDESPEEQLQVLLETPIDDFIERIGRQINLGPIVDGEIIPQATNYAVLEKQDDLSNLFPGLRQCTRIFIGDCEIDGMIWGLRVARRTDILPQTIERALTKVLGSETSSLAHTIISNYGIDVSATANSPGTLKPILDLGHDLTFALPTNAFTQAFRALGTDMYTYHFDCPNPWAGPWQGYATHCLDLMFVLQNYRDHLAGGQQKAANNFAHHVVSFVNGLPPFPNDAPSRRMVYNAPMEGSEDESKLVDDGLEKGGRRKELLRSIPGPVLDNVLDAWHMFMAGTV